MANPQKVFVSAFIGGGQTSESSAFTFSYAMTSDFDALIPIVVRVPNTTGISAGPEITVYRSNDGGTTWETEGSFIAAFSKPTTASQVMRKDILLTRGYYLISVQMGGGGAVGFLTYSVMAQTAEVTSAYA